MCYKSPGYGPKQLTGYDAYGAMCDATPGCVAFTVPPGFTGCAYMKKAGKRESTKTRKDWFVGTSAVKAVTCRFEGNKCSMDQWAEPFYCCGGEPAAAAAPPPHPPPPGQPSRSKQPPPSRSPLTAHAPGRSLCPLP